MLLRLISFLLFSGIALAACQSSESSAKFSGNTKFYYDNYYGPQIEYYGTDGVSHLWFPGNRVSVPAKWKIRFGDICFKYPTSSYDPVTKEYGGKWECRALARQKQRVVHTCVGDPFKLATGKVPYRLAKNRGEIAKLKRSCN